jgi:hypothetical protein
MTKPTAENTAEVLRLLRRKNLLSHFLPESLKIKEVSYTEL